MQGAIEFARESNASDLAEGCIARLKGLIEVKAFRDACAPFGTKLDKAKGLYTSGKTSEALALMTSTSRLRGAGRYF